MPPRSQQGPGVVQGCQFYPVFGIRVSTGVSTAICPIRKSLYHKRLRFRCNGLKIRVSVVQFHSCPFVKFLAGKSLWLSAFFVFSEMSLLQQILAQPTGVCQSRSVQQVVRYGKIELVRCLEICMPSKLHHVVFTHTLGEPVADSLHF